MKNTRFWFATQFGRPSAAGASAGVRLGGSADGLDAFGSEADRASDHERTAAVTAAPVTVGGNRVALAVAKWTAVVVLTAALAVAAVFGYQRRFAPPVTTGQVTFETTPAGLDVVIAGRALGKTPLTATLTAGAYEVQVGSPPNVRVVKLNVSAATSLVQRLELAPAAVGPAATTGSLRIQTEPTSLPVVVDGKLRGVSPVAIDDLESGAHEVSVRTSAGLIKRAVSLKPGETLSLVVSSASPLPDPTAVSAGWMTVSAPVPLQLREGGKLIGTSESERLMLPAGDHDIEFTNADLGFTTRKTVRVAAGKMAATRVDLPNGAISLNAQPWAEVWIDGERVGETPIGNLSRPIGTHEVVFRHPELGERRQSVVLVVGKPTRIGVDLRKK